LLERDDLSRIHDVTVHDALLDGRQVGIGTLSSAPEVFGMIKIFERQE
jgi:hypothetical protein